MSYLFPWLFHLNQYRDDEENQDYAWWDTNDSAMGLSDLMEKSLRSFLCEGKRCAEKTGQFKKQRKWQNNKK